jgi:hypothetical protein
MSEDGSVKQSDVAECGNQFGQIHRDILINTARSAEREPLGSSHNRRFQLLWIVDKDLKVCDGGILVQLLCFWTLSSVLVLFKTHNVSKYLSLLSNMCPIPNGFRDRAISLYSTLYTVQTSNTPCPHTICRVH